MVPVFFHMLPYLPEVHVFVTGYLAIGGLVALITSLLISISNKCTTYRVFPQFIFTQNKKQKVKQQ